MFKLSISIISIFLLLASSYSFDAFGHSLESDKTIEERCNHFADKGTLY